MHDQRWKTSNKTILCSKLISQLRIHVHVHVLLIVECTNVCCTDELFFILLDCNQSIRVHVHVHVHVQCMKDKTDGHMYSNISLIKSKGFDQL